MCLFFWRNFCLYSLTIANGAFLLLLNCLRFSWHLCWKPNDHNVSVYFWTPNSVPFLSLYLFLCHTVYFVSHFFGYCIFIVSLEIGKFESSYRGLLQDCVAYSESFVFPYEVLGFINFSANKCSYSLETSTWIATSLWEVVEFPWYEHKRDPNGVDLSPNLVKGWCDM